MKLGSTSWLLSLSLVAFAGCGGTSEPSAHGDKDAGATTSDAPHADAPPATASPDTGPEVPAPVSGGGEGPSASGPAKPPSGGGGGGGGGFKPDDGAD